VGIFRVKENIYCVWNYPQHRIRLIILILLSFAKYKSVCNHTAVEYKYIILRRYYRIIEPRLLYDVKNAFAYFSHCY